MWESIGTIVMGRHLFDLTNGREGQPPAGDHVAVVSHRPEPDGWHPEASYHFHAVRESRRRVDVGGERPGGRRVAGSAAGGW